MHLVLGDAGIRAEDVAEHARGDRAGARIGSHRRVGRRCRPPERTRFRSAWTGQPIDLVTKVIADEREGAIGEPGGERSGGGLIGADGCATLVDTFEHDLVFTHMQTLTARASDRLHAYLGRTPQVVHRRIPCLRESPAGLRRGAARSSCLLARDGCRVDPLVKRGRVVRPPSHSRRGEWVRRPRPQQWFRRSVLLPGSQRFPSLGTVGTSNSGVLACGGMPAASTASLAGATRFAPLFPCLQAPRQTSDGYEEVPVPYVDAPHAAGSTGTEDLLVARRVRKPLLLSQNLFGALRG